MSGGKAGGAGGLQMPHSRQSQLVQWSDACFALHHGAHDVRSHAGAARASGMPMGDGGHAQRSYFIASFDGRFVHVCGRYLSMYELGMTA